MGSNGDDVLTGGAKADTISGLGGGDKINGGGGDDVLKGDAGNDELLGGGGSDTLYGGNGYDMLYADATGDDHLYGDDGNDWLWFEPIYGPDFETNWGDLLMDGGAGDDYIYAFERRGGRLSVNAGSGDDEVRVHLSRDARINGGSGDDTITLSSGYWYDTSVQPAASVTLGTGRDVLHFSPYGTEWRITVTDFAVGAKGDRLDLGSVLDGISFYGSGNPFALGYLSLQQSGKHTKLFYDPDGKGGAAATHLATLNDTKIAALDEGNLGWRSDGKSSAAMKLSGTKDEDEIVGLGGNDRLRGKDGNDTLSGGGGDDQIDGGNGDDDLDGGFGDNLLIGGSGNDSLTSSHSANDRLYGGDGVDYLHRTEGSRSSTVLLDGGAGDDSMSVFVGQGVNATIIGGSGNDAVFFANIHESFQASIDMGEGNDRVEVELGLGDYDIKLGKGSDVVGLNLTSYDRSAAATATVADFMAGSKGDRINATYLLKNLVPGEEYDAVSEGYLRLVSRGKDTLIQVDVDGGGDGFATMLTLAGVKAQTLKSFNLDGLQFKSIAQQGGKRADALTGTKTGEELDGGRGDDVLTGLGGSDVLYGGSGNDHLTGGTDRDNLYGDSGADMFVFNDGDFGGSTAGRCDRIYDFDGGEQDRIDLSAVDARSGGRDNAFTFVGKAAFTGRAGELRYGSAPGGHTLVSGDTNGDGSADFAIWLAGKHTLTAGDFVL